jgi:hypothetical protein
MSCHSGPAPELTVAQVLKVFLPEYLDRHSVPAHQLKVLRRLAQCRSGQLGWTVWQCDQCHRSHWRPHGCGDRHCPTCQHQRSRDWLERQRGSLLPVRYFHWVFTLPAALRPLVLQNQAALYQALFDSASTTLLQFGQERFQAELGITAILHTWGQNLMNHPHLHCLVTGGGLTAQNTWAGPKQARWLFPVQAVAKMFQGKFCAALLQLHLTGKLQFHAELQPLQNPAAFASLLGQLQSRRWVVFAKGSVVGPEHVLDYLGRYTHRVAISNSRLRSIDASARTVAFTYKDYADAHRLKTLTLSGVEFIPVSCCTSCPKASPKFATTDYSATTAANHEWLWHAPLWKAPRCVSLPKPRHAPSPHTPRCPTVRTAKAPSCAASVAPTVGAP